MLRTTRVIMRPGGSHSQGMLSSTVSDCARLSMLPQVGVGGRTPMPRKAQARLGEDRAGDGERAGDDDRRCDVGQDMAEHDPPGSRADATAGHDEIAFTQTQCFRSHQARNARPAEDPDDEHHVVDARAEHRHQADDDDQRRDRHHHVGQAHEPEIHFTAQKPARQSDQGADGDADAGCDEPHGQGDLRAPDQPTQHIAPRVVGAQQMCRGRRLAQSACIDSQGIVRRDDGRGDGGYDQNDEQNGARDGQPMPHEAAQKAPPRCGGSATTLVIKRVGVDGRRIGSGHNQAWSKRCLNPDEHDLVPTNTGCVGRPQHTRYRPTDC